MASRRSGYTRAFRIVSPDYPPFDGAGAYRWGSRWGSPGRWVVHAAETYALAVLENLAHWQASVLPRRLVWVEVQIPHALDQERLDPARIPGWNDPDYIVSRAAGDEWYERGATAVLWVPSVISPYEANVLFNQVHADFSRIRVGEAQPARIDPRCGGADIRIRCSSIAKRRRSGALGHADCHRKSWLHWRSLSATRGS